MKNPPGRVDLSLNSQMPAWHHIDIPYYVSAYMHPRFTNVGRTLPMLTGRGCTGGCSFCSPTVGKFMSRNLEDTLNEIRYLNANYEFETFSFITEIFFLTDEQVLEFCEGYKTPKCSPHISTPCLPLYLPKHLLKFNN